MKDEIAWGQKKAKNKLAEFSKERKEKCRKITKKENSVFNQWKIRSHDWNPGRDNIGWIEKVKLNKIENNKVFYWKWLQKTPKTHVFITLKKKTHQMKIVTGIL